MTIRVLRLDLPGGPVELHARLTVVDARDKPRRKGIVKALAAMSSGESPGVTGVIEAQGILLDLGAEAIELLDLHEPVDNVVKADELTGGDGRPEPVPDPEPEVDETQPESEALVAARGAHADALRAASTAAGALAAARTGRDPFASAALDIARARLAALEAGEEDDLSGEDDQPTIEYLRARTNELEAALVALDAVDPFPVRIALDQLERSAANRVPRAEAEAVVAEIGAIDRELAGEAARGGGPSPLLDVAQQRLDEARDALFAAERAVRVPDLDRDVAARIEDAHDRVVKAEGRAQARFRRRRAQRQLDEARAAERELLDGVGFPTHADFMMGTSIAHLSPEAEAQLERARRELADAEDMVSALAADADAALTHAVLVGRRAQLQKRATELQSDHEPTAKLRTALESAGFVFDAAPVQEAVLIELAHVWLEEQRDVAAHRRRVEEELVSIERRLAAANPLGLGQSRDAALDDARAAVAAAEVRLARHRDADEEVARRQAAYYGLVTEEANAAERVAALAETRPPRPVPAGLRPDRHRRDSSGAGRDLDWHLLTRVAGVRSASYAGSVPLVLDRALDGLPPDVIATSLERLERLASSVQTVVVSWDEAVLRWAAGLSSERAAFIR